MTAAEPPAPSPDRLGEVLRYFARLGVIAFGGPAAHIAIMRRELVVQRKWLTDQEFIDHLGVTNLIPGPNSTELTMHMGARRAGWAGLWVGGAALALIGLTNMLGTLGCGVLGDRVSKTRLLAGLYTLRGLITLWFLLTPISPASVMIFSAIMGLTWLGTVPLTSGVVAQIFGVRYLGTLVGVVFLMHQVGSFLGAWLGGLAFELRGSYDIVWWSVVVLAFVAAVIHLAIDERPSGSGAGRSVRTEAA